MYSENETSVIPSILAYDVQASGLLYPKTRRPDICFVNADL